MPIHSTSPHFWPFGPLILTQTKVEYATPQWIMMQHKLYVFVGYQGMITMWNTMKDFQLKKNTKLTYRLAYQPTHCQHLLNYFQI